MDLKLFRNVLIVVIILVSLALLSTNLVLAAGDDDKEGVLHLLELSGKAAKYDIENIGDDKDINMASVIGRIIKIFLSLLGAIFIVLMIYGGYEWMMARGNTEQIDKARETIKNAIIGLVIVVGAYAISYFVLYYFTQNYFQSGATGF